MNQPQIVLILMVIAIVGTAVALFRQGMLGIKSLTAVAVATIGIGTFLIVTLTPP